jgi:3-oxoacyl-[acyl-carrier protein] reductase
MHMNVIITGASQGIGLQLVKKMLDSPEIKVIAISRNILPLIPFLHNNNFKSLALDVSDLASFESLSALLVDFFDGKINIVINNAGALINKPFEELLPEDFDLMFDVNVKGIFFMLQKLLPYFNKPSHIVNIGSMGGYQGSAKFPGLSLYSASKGALCILSECLAEELKPKKIAVNTLALGAVDTEMLRAAFPGYTAEVSATDMAGYIKEFALNGNKFYNGKILPVSFSTP